MGIQWQTTFFVNHNVNILSLKNVAWLEDAQVFFFKFSWIDAGSGKNELQTNVWNIRKITERFLTKLHLSNLGSTIFVLVS